VLNINIIFLVGFELIAIAFGLFVYVKMGQNFNALLLALYTFGFFALSGFFTAFPGGTKAKNEWGDKTKTGNINNLSKKQAFILFAWLICFGVYLVYQIEFKNAL
jgi:hypothetical protein